MLQPPESQKNTATSHSQDQDHSLKNKPVYHYAPPRDTAPDPPPIEEWEKKLLGKRLIKESEPGDENVGPLKLML